MISEKSKYFSLQNGIFFWGTTMAEKLKQKRFNKIKAAIVSNLKAIYLLLEMVTVLIVQIVGYFIFAASAWTYVNRLMEQAGGQVFTIGIAAFGLIATLSGLCYRMAPTVTDEDEKRHVLYSGEKFLHSSVLLIQTIFLKYVKDATPPQASPTWFNRGFNIVFIVILFLLTAFAVGAFLYGFESLNDVLWKKYGESKRFKERAEEIIKE
jgi:hypothetical protein